MNKRMKFLFALLFIVIAALAVAIARFFSDTGQNTNADGTKTAIYHRLDKDGSGNLIFQDNSGFYGIADSNDRITVSPEWRELSFAEPGICIAEKHIGSKDLLGCISYEGDVIVPFIYKNIERHEINNCVFYAATVYSDNSTVIYDSHFSPYLRGAWKSCEVTSDGLILKSDNGTYIYYAAPNGLTLNRASFSGCVSSSEYTLDITSKLLLSKLSVPMIETMAENAGTYLRYAFFEDSEPLVNNIHSADKAEFFTLFQNEKRIVTKRLMGITDIFLYSVRSEEDVPHYAVAVTADTLISYHDDDNNLCNLRDNYKAVIEFKGHSSADLEAVSGKFLLDAPEYPKPETEQPTDTAAVNNVENGRKTN